MTGVLGNLKILDRESYRQYRKRSARADTRNATFFAGVLVAVMLAVSWNHIGAVLGAGDYSFLTNFSHRQVFLVSLVVYAVMLLLLLFYRGPGRKLLPAALMLMVLAMGFALGQLDARTGASILGFALGVIFVSMFLSMDIRIAVAFYGAYFLLFYFLAEMDGVFAPYRAEYIPLVGLVIGLACVMEVNRQRRFRDRQTIREQLAQLEETVEFKANIISQISHELKTPLNAIIGFSRIIADTDDKSMDPADTRESAEIINQSGNHLLDMINNILLLNKKNAAKLTVNLVPLDLGRELRETLPLVETDRKQRGHTLDYTADEALPVVLADKMMIKQVNLNILSNAIKYTPDGGTITVSLTSDGDKVRLTVSDNGPGMTAEEVSHALEPFNQVESALLDDNTGTGLGLPIIRELTDSMGIDLEIQSEKGVGTRMILTFGPAKAS